MISQEPLYVVLYKSDYYREYYRYRTYEGQNKICSAVHREHIQRQAGKEIYAQQFIK